MRQFKMLVAAFVLTQSFGLLVGGLAKAESPMRLAPEGAEVAATHKAVPNGPTTRQIVDVPQGIDQKAGAVCRICSSLPGREGDCIDMPACYCRGSCPDQPPRR